MDDVLNQRIEKLCGLVREITHLPVTIGKTAFTSQYKGPFIALWPVSFEEVPKDTHEYIARGNMFFQKVRGLGLLAVEAQAFGKNCQSNLRRLKLSFASDIWNMAEGTCELAYSSSGEVQMVPAQLLDSNYEDRAILEMQFYTAVPDEFVVDYFDKEKLTNKVYINGVSHDPESIWVGNVDKSKIANFGNDSIV